MRDLIRSITPRFIRQLVRRPLGRVDPKLSREAAHNYWRAPADAGNLPEHYSAIDDERSAALHQLIRPLTTPTSAILELGCNAGRNLNYLYAQGFRNLAGIEINPGAIEVFRKSFPDAARATDIRVGTIEEHIPRFESKSMDVIFTMAVLVHVHPDSEAIFDEVVRAAKHLVIIEDEETLKSTRHYRRNYKKVFEARGAVQTQSMHPVPGLKGMYVARVFKCP